MTHSNEFSLLVEEVEEPPIEPPIDEELVYQADDLRVYVTGTEVRVDITATQASDVIVQRFFGE